MIPFPPLCLVYLFSVPVRSIGGVIAYLESKLKTIQCLTSISICHVRQEWDEVGWKVWKGGGEICESIGEDLFERFWSVWG